jgi:hypothetical protein
METRTANDPYGRVETRAEAKARVQLQLTLASGAALLGFVGWLLTL